MTTRLITSPVDRATLRGLHAGEEVLLSGIVYTARDAAHGRLAALLREGKPLPLDLAGQTIFYAGPSPARPGAVVGSIGPTTSGRMDIHTPRLIEQAGVAAMIGKGDRCAAVIEAMKRFGAVYFAAIGGAAALLGRTVRSVETVCWEDLGPEAVRRIVVENMPLIVAIDSRGSDLYLDGPRRLASAVGE